MISFNSVSLIFLIFISFQKQRKALSGQKLLFDFILNLLISIREFILRYRTYDTVKYNRNFLYYLKSSSNRHGITKCLPNCHPCHKYKPPLNYYWLEAERFA